MEGVALTQLRAAIVFHAYRQRLRAPWRVGIDLCKRKCRGNMRFLKPQPPSRRGYGFRSTSAR